MTRLIQVLCELFFSPFYQVIMASNGKEGLDKHINISLI